MNYLKSKISLQHSLIAAGSGKYKKRGQVFHYHIAICTVKKIKAPLVG